MLRRKFSLSSVITKCTVTCYIFYFSPLSSLVLRLTTKIAILCITLCLRQIYCKIGLWNIIF
jgi:hypothetical protein